VSGRLSGTGSLVEGTGYFTEEVRGNQERTVGVQGSCVEGAGLVVKFLKQHPLQGHTGIHHDSMVHSLLARFPLLPEQRWFKGSLEV
jgi:hypothetical protein